jgi:chemotaxis protein CheZ
MNAALRMRAIIMVKIRLNVKRAAAQLRKHACFRGYFRLAFIFSKCRAVMVNALAIARITPMNPVLSGFRLQTTRKSLLGALMPKQRRKFRVEEMTHGEMPAEIFAENNSENASRHAELMAELRSLRAMMASGARPAATGEAAPRDANVVEVAQEARKIRSQFDVIEQAIKKTKGEMFSPPEHGLDGGQIARVMQELAAVKEGTTDATDRLLKSAETIEQTSSTLIAALKGGHEQGLAQDIQDQVTQIFEACNFHDLTSQRISKVVTTLKSVEDHLEQMVEIWNAIERFTNYVGRLAPPTGDESMLNGPKLDGDEGHASQNDVDAMFH